jgi:PAS domain S-box-containing protein
VKDYQMAATLAYSDAYISKYFNENSGIVVIEDYSNVKGADFEASKKYFDYYKNRPFFLGAVLYNMLPLIKFSFNLARRLHFYNENAYAVDSYETAVQVASDILNKSTAPAEKPGIGDSARQGIIAPASVERFKNKFHQRPLILNLMLSPVINRIRGFFINEYAQSLLTFVEAIDWNKEGVQPLEDTFYKNPALRKVPDAINFIKSEVDNLIRERLKAEKVLLKSEARLRQVVEHAKAGIWEYDYGTDKIISTNSALVDITGYSREEILSMSPMDFLTDDSREKFKEQLALLHSGHPVSPDFIYETITKNGDIKWVLVNANIIYRDNRPYRADIVLSDITSLKMIENKLMEYQSKLKGLTIALSMSEENQRRRLASEFHDRIGQELFVTQLRLEAFRKTLVEPAHVRDLSGIVDRVVQLIRDSRSLISDISPPVLYDFGFQEADEGLARTTESKYNLRITTDFSGVEKEMSDIMKVILYRNIKEILHNTIKHANAKNLHISSHQTESHVHIFVKDDGVGIDMAAMTNDAFSDKGFGLFDIREKIDHLGGFLDVDSAPGSGFSLSMKVPLS